MIGEPQPLVANCVVVGPMPAFSRRERCGKNDLDGANRRGRAKVHHRLGIAMKAKKRTKSEEPMVVMSGEALTYGEDPNFDPGAQWYRSLSVVGGPHRLVESVTKWSGQAPSIQTLYETFVRGGELAQRTPKGPVYVNVPIETMLREWTPP
jgi:hypothetical protein